MELTDIENRNDVELLINAFYEKVRANPVIGYIFNDVAKVNWQHHLPVMYSFWSGILLGEQSYTGNPMAKHIELSKITTLSEKEFGEWLRLFFETTDELFAGATANEAKTRASHIARLMLHKIQSAGKTRL